MPPKTTSSKQVQVPELVYFVLPPYEVPDLIVIGGVVIENRGLAPANNVKIVLDYDDPNVKRIRHLQVEGDVEYILLGGGDLHSFATLRVKQFHVGQRMIIFFSGPDRISPNVKVTHYEG